MKQRIHIIIAYMLYPLLNKYLSYYIFIHSKCRNDDASYNNQRKQKLYFYTTVCLWHPVNQVFQMILNNLINIVPE